MLIQNQFEIGEAVFIKSDPDKETRIISAIEINPNGLMYKVSCGIVDTWHYATELETQPILDE